MRTVPHVSKAIHSVLSDAADRAAIETGLVRRRSKLTGSIFTKTLVFGWLRDPGCSLASLTQMAATLGVRISPQALFQRFSSSAAQCLKQVLDAALKEVIASEPATIPIFQRFSAVVIQDSSTIMLPDALRDVWKGCGGTNVFGRDQQ